MDILRPAILAFSPVLMLVAAVTVVEVVFSETADCIGTTADDAVLCRMSITELAVPETIVVGEEPDIRTTVRTMAGTQEFVHILVVRDAAGSVVHLSHEEGVIHDGTATLSTRWEPPVQQEAAKRYEVTAYVWSSLDSPEAISYPKSAWTTAKAAGPE